MTQFVNRLQHSMILRLLACAALIAASAGWGDESVVHTRHNLSASGPGTVRAVSEDQVCIFCHAPHNASPALPMWNRHNPTAYYRIYRSSTMEARVDQPGGPSKMCLSCHDGSVAMGLVLNRPPTDPITLNQPFMPTGPSNLTNDLSDDHPIGFRFDRQLSNRDRQLRSPDMVSHQVKLGTKGELECTACHDPHNNELGNFLRVTDREGALCNTCHRMDGWDLSSHRRSGRAVPAAVTNGILRSFRSMSDNACASCHSMHNAASRPRLLNDRPSDLCIKCHDGIGGFDMLPTLNMRSGHRFRRIRDVHDPKENPFVMRPHVECVDCHNPHAVLANLTGNPLIGGGLQGPLVPPAMNFVPGVRLSGAPVDRAFLYYEVCFRCHADNPVPVQRIFRQQDNSGNIRRLFLPTVASSHPVARPNTLGTEVPSLIPLARLKPFMSCQDCHNNPDARELGGFGANGPHGSPFPFLLVNRYDTADFTVESPQAYALCYRCHDRASILSDQSFRLHNRHVVQGRTPCSSCHAPHGVSGSSVNHGHLINFDVSIVGGQRQFVDTGMFQGSCTLTCHGVAHVNFTYGP